MKRSLLFFTIFAIAVSHLCADENTIDSAIQKISDSQYQIGLVTLDKSTRQISFPASVHISDTETIIEYLITHSTGEKVHETLLITEAEPTHINLAFKLLSYPESQELFRNDSEPLEESKLAIEITIESKTTPITSWLQHRVTKKPMPNTPWIYNGSYISKKQFMAQTNGNIFSILTEPSSIGNYAGDDRADDTLWFPSARIPETGSEVTVTVKPWKL